MKKLMLFCMVYMMCAAVTVPAFAAEIKDGEAKTPEVEAHGAILMDAETGRVLWEKNAHAPLAMASTTKIMTAIVALENSGIDETVTVTKRAAQTPPVKMFLSAGEKISLKALLYALMMQSSNDAAVAIAEHVGGSVENFCGMMTEKAKGLGAKDTVFETPNGLDFGDHHSTAYDMALIARYALKNKEFISITNTPYITVSSDRSTYSVTNKNRLLNEFSGANGIKTGYTGKAGHCFVGAAKRDGMQLISVVLASGWGGKGKEQKWVDTKRVLNYGFDHYKYETLLEEGKKAGDVAVTRSKSDRVGVCFGEGVVLPMRENEKETVRIEINLPESVKAPVKRDESIGSAQFYIGDALYKEIALFTDGSAERFDMKTCAETVLDTFMRMGTKRYTKVTLPEFEFWQ
ncbi:MAG: D-alanyl-D-alanine carboxypeptidase [Clostridiales bacterium]|jgi:D-alanyl-D-alanine carboxypeptidase (penicillin-binding protein 5/6)|nr:D-alanyl-D-alanine carboxypeptidase [Clostridiales bacterium]